MNYEELAHIDFKDLLGEHQLSGVDTENIELEIYGSKEACQTINFILDGEVYSGCENPDDGYRSSLQYFIKTDKKVNYTFPPVKVLARMAEDDEYAKNDVLELVDMANGKVVLSVGTSNYDDYYPSFVGHWEPKNLAVNQP